MCAVVAAGCSATSSSGGNRQAQPRASTSSTSAPAPSANTVWLCRPDKTPNPCTSSLASTAVLADGTTRREPLPKPGPRLADCFYVYPTVSRERRRNSDLRIQPAQVNVAIAQASRFSSVCRVWAPMYRQRTVSSLLNLADAATGSAANRVAFASLRSAWRDYLTHHNSGRPVVLVGHSQGAAMLVRLIRADVDPNPALRRRVALAIVLGGNVTVATGRTTGGSFQHVPLCTRHAQARCVIAYSSFPSEPPALALFGRPGLGVSALSGEAARPGVQVACVNPSDIGGGRAPLHPYLPTRLAGSGAGTPWTSYPDRYTSVCRHRDGATWLQVSPTHLAGDRRPLVHPRLGAAWGFHVYDVNLALGDLVADVAAAVTTWQRTR